MQGTQVWSLVIKIPDTKKKKKKDPRCYLAQPTNIEINKRNKKNEEILMADKYIKSTQTQL